MERDATHRDRAHSVDVRRGRSEHLKGRAAISIVTFADRVRLGATARNDEVVARANVADRVGDAGLVRNLKVRSDRALEKVDFARVFLLSKADLVILRGEVRPVAVIPVVALESARVASVVLSAARGRLVRVRALDLADFDLPRSNGRVVVPAECELVAVVLSLEEHVLAGVGAADNGRSVAIGRRLKLGVETLSRLLGRLKRHRG